jgi:hypothetical protein
MYLRPALPATTIATLDYADPNRRVDFEESSGAGRLPNEKLLVDLPQFPARLDFYWPVMPMKASVFVTGGGFHLPVSTSDLGA